MNFSTNQVMQFYVLPSNEVKMSDTITGRGFSIAIDDEHRTDIIENVMWVKAVSSNAYDTPTMTIKVEVDEAAFVEDANGVLGPVVGEDYVIRVSYPEVGGLGVEGWTTKTVVVTAAKGETKESLTEKLVKQLEKVLAVDAVLTVTENLTITVNIGALIDSYDRGRFPIVAPTFNVTTSVITVDGVPTIPFKVDEKGQFAVTKGETIPGVYKLAEMEYFAMGERGDQYRKMGWPDYVPTDYKVDIKASYDVVHVHYAYKGDNASSYKSEKDLILAVPAGKAGIIASAIATKADVEVISVPKE